MRGTGIVTFWWCLRDHFLDACARLVVSFHLAEDPCFEQVILQNVRGESEGTFGGFECGLRALIIKHDSGFQRECRDVVRVDAEYLLDPSLGPAEVTDEIIALSKPNFVGQSFAYLGLQNTMT